jgi:hypothetical protein
MNIKNRVLIKNLVHSALIIVFLGVSLQSYSQDLKYDPKGDPNKWNFVITPFLLLPNISGEVQSKRLSEDFGIGPSDFIKTLHFTFMMDAEISKENFFASLAYVYTNDDVEKILWTSADGTQTIAFYPGL